MRMLLNVSLPVVFLAAAMASAQSTPAPAQTSQNADDNAAKQSSAPVQAAERENSGKRTMTIPSGTQVLLYLKSPIDTKSAKVGDGVYCQTSFPVTQDNVVVIPAGTYVKGEIREVRRAGRIKGRAEVLFYFTSMIFPSGYTVDLPGALKSEPGARNSTVSDDEGTVKADSQKGKDAATVGKTAATGGVIGAAATRSWSGAGIGGAAGAAIGLGQVLFTRGQDVRIDQGTALEMVLERPLTVEVSHAPDTARAESNVVPQPGTVTRLPRPKTPK
jgi:hypothetical protein